MLVGLFVVGGAILGGIIGAAAKSTDTGKKMDYELKHSANDMSKMLGKGTPFPSLEDKRNG